MIKNLNKIPRSVTIIKEQLADLAKVMNSINYNIEFDFATKATLASLRVHEEELNKELKAAEWLENHYDLELTIEGAIVAEHAIPMNFLSKLLDKVQKLRLASAEIASGSFRDSGRFTNKLWEKNQFMVECFTPSSFAIQLSYPKDIQKTLFTNFDLDKHGENLFLSLLSGDNDIEDFATITLSPRLRSYYQDFLSFLAENDVVISTRTKTHPYRVKMTPTNARKRKEIINFTSPTIKEEEIEIVGILVMGDLKNNSFAIDADESIFRGQVSSDGSEGLKRFALGSKVKAKLLITTVTDDSGRSSYTLLSLNDATA
jgi:hypothetical protein